MPFCSNTPWRIPLLCFYACIGVLYLSAGPSVYDAGELAAAAWDLGASHPPGQPLHAILAHAIAWIPVGPIPYRMALLSLLTELLAAFWLARLIEALHFTLCGKAIAENLENANWSSKALRFAPDAAAIALLLSPPVIRQAMRIEVYGLSLSLTLFALCRIVQWKKDYKASYLYQAALAFGLCFAVHPPHALVILGAALISALISPLRHWFRVKQLSWLTVAGLLGAFVYAWLPLRAKAGAETWGDPTNLAGFWDYLSAKAYRMNLGVEQSSAVVQLADAIGYSLSACGMLPLIGVALLALPLLKKQSRSWSTLLWLVTLLFVSLMAASLQALETSNPDNVAYFGPITALLLALGVTGFVLFAEDHENRVLAIGAIALIALNIPSLPRVAHAFEADVPALETLSGALTEAAPPHALVIVETDFFAASWMQAKSIDGARPDVPLFISGLATSSWHWKRLAKHRGMDGIPLRGQGSHAFEAFNDGIVIKYHQKMPILSESHKPTRGQGYVLGAYVFLPSQGQNFAQSMLDSSMAERWTSAIGRDTMLGPRGDYGTAAAVLRYYEVHRAKRLVLSNRSDEALQAIRYALFDLSEHELTLLNEASVKKTLIPPPAVHEPHTFLLSKEDAVREAASLLWAMGSDEAARALLDAQLERGDPRSVLQLAWLRLAEGDFESARVALDAFLSVAPELANEASPLSAHLEPRPEPLLP
ncbi:MAG: DUF2723 domain-containing protein [Myxococcales bacterium]|nr:MAG: DUF2723 domain-containing protein [Myxococcales bacterium]